MNRLKEEILNEISALRDETNAHFDSSGYFLVINGARRETFTTA